MKSISFARTPDVCPLMILPVANVPDDTLNTAFGGQGADKLLVKITTILATLFMALSIGLNILSSPEDIVNNTDDVLDGTNKIDIEVTTPPDTTR